MLKSGPICGGVIDGKPQAPPCPSKYATYHGPSPRACPEGSTQAEFSASGRCFDCPEGMLLNTFFPANSDRACVEKDPNVKHEFMKATWIGRLCPEGSFYDPVRGGECWSCPEGFKRSAASVASKNACVRGPVGKEEVAKATVVAIAECEAGSFLDVVKKGCWKCPEAARRTVFPVDGDRACARPGGRRFAPAIETGRVDCPAGQMWTTVEVNDEDLAEMRKRAMAANDTAEVKRLEGLRGTTGMTCWSCPAGYRRSVAGMKTADACTPAYPQWFTAPFVEPGLFRLAGASAVLLDIVRSTPKLALDALNKAAGAMAAAKGISKEQALAQQKALLSSNPEKSPAASAMLLVRVMDSVVAAEKASAAEKALVESFRAYISKRRQYFAQDALDQYDAWKAVDDYSRSRTPASLGTLADYGTVPPDFGALALLGAVAGFVRDTAVGVALDSVPVLGEVLTTAFSVAGNGFADFSSVDKGIRFSARTGSEIALGGLAEFMLKKLTDSAANQALRSVAVRLTVKAGATWGLEATEALVTAAGSIGPQIIIGVAFMVGSMAFDQANEIKNARPKLLTMLGVAKQLPDLQRMAKTEEGLTELLSLWAAAASGASTYDPALRKDLAAATAALAP